MLSKSRIRMIRSLDIKKNRLACGLFLAEGKKLVSDLLDSEIEIEFLVSTPQNLPFFLRSGTYPPEIIEASEEEIKKASLMRNPQGCLAVCRIPGHELPEDAGENSLIICLQDIQDPGNMGTILRLSDWFGIGDIVCSPASADVYNPKVIQATMGAIGRIRVHYSALAPFLRLKKEKNVTVYGTFPEGENIYSTSLTPEGIIVLGNEGKGISEELYPLLSRRITIPDFSAGNQKPESLNVSIAAAIVVSEFRRRAV